MNVLQICDYLNEIGILDINNIKNYLALISNIKNNNSNYKTINDIYRISLFAYFKGINNNDKNLYFLCSNIINSYNKYYLIKKYNFLHNLKKIVYYKILQRFKYFMISLYRKYPRKNYHSNIKYNNKKNKIQNNTCSNRFYKKNNSFQNLTENNNNYLNQNYINSSQQINKLKIELNSQNINNNNAPPLNYDNIYKDKIIYKELHPIKKCQNSNINICINQSNINYEKLFINKRLVICKKCRPSYIEKIKENKKELYKTSDSLRKTKSETKLRIKKMDFEEKTRSQNLAKIKPELQRKIKDRAKSKKDQEFYDKQKEDKLFNKLTEKEIDRNNLLDRLYRKNIIEKRKEERKQKEVEINNIKKSPINWEEVYLQTNDKIINKNNNNNRKKNKTCSYFMPNRGRIYKYVEDEKYNNKIIKDNKNINKNVDNKEEKNKDIKENEINSQNKEIIKNENEEKFDNNTKEIVNIINNSNNNEIENKKSLEKKDDDNDGEKDEKKSDNNSLQESINFNEKMAALGDKYNISSGGFKSKELQELLKKNSNNNNGNTYLNISEEGKKDEKLDEENGNKLKLSNGDYTIELDDLLC